MTKIEMIADSAEVIIAGYAIEKCEEGIRIFNLNNQKSAAVFQKDGTLIETNMDDIEVAIARDYLMSSLKYMEE